MEYSLDYIEKLLINNPLAVERGIVALYKLQTPAEQQFDRTFHHNKMGFNEVDARLGSYYAKWILKGNKLNDKHLRRARKIVLKYKKQLHKIANQ